MILIHDAARAEITEEIIGRNIAAMRENEATCTVVPMIDSLRMTEKKTASEFFDDLSSHNDYLIINSKSIDRDRVVAVQTPQCFKLSSLMHTTKRDVMDMSVQMMPLSRSILG